MFHFILDNTHNITVLYAHLYRYSMIVGISQKLESYETFKFKWKHVYKEQEKQTVTLHIQVKSQLLTFYYFTPTSFRISRNWWRYTTTQHTAEVIQVNFEPNIL